MVNPTIHMPSEQPIDNCIRRLRFEHGEITQEALATAVGITRQTIIALEASRYAPSLALAMKIAEVFGRRVDDVFFSSTALAQTRPRSMAARFNRVM